MSDTHRHPRHFLDDVIHAPVRLSIMAALTAGDAVEFRYLRDLLEVSDSLLSKHLTTLEQAGYLTIAKVPSGRRVRTWLSVTDAGRAAFQQYVQTLSALLGASSPGSAERQPREAARRIP